MHSANVQHGEAARLLVVQSILIAVVAAAFLVAGGSAAALAALFGGAVELVRSALLARTLSTAMRAAREQPGTETTALYLGAVQRFGAVLGLFGLGMGWIGLAPFPMLVAFAAVQVAALLARAVRQARHRAPAVRAD